MRRPLSKTLGYSLEEVDVELIHTLVAQSQGEVASLKEIREINGIKCLDTISRRPLGWVNCHCCFLSYSDMNQGFRSAGAFLW